VLIKADFHIHSLVSDGSMHPREIVRIAKKKNLKAIAITDHDSFEGSILANRNDCGSIIVLYGAEVRTEYGDVLVLCTHPIRIYKKLSELVTYARLNNCLLIPAHPFDIIRAGVGRLAYLKIWDGIECWNGSSDLLTNMLAWATLQGTRNASIANSDAHVPEMLGIPYNIVEVKDLTRDDVLEALRKGHVKPIPGYTLSGLASKWSWTIRRRLMP